MFRASDVHLIVISPCENNICWACCPTRCVFHCFSPACISSDIQVFQTVKDINTFNPVVDLLESIQSLLKSLDIYNKVPRAASITGIVVKTLVELLSILALATSFINQGQPGTFFSLTFYLTQLQHRESGEDAFWMEIRRESV